MTAVHRARSADDRERRSRAPSPLRREPPPPASVVATTTRPARPRRRRSSRASPSGQRRMPRATLEPEHAVRAVVGHAARLHIHAGALFVAEASPALPDCSVYPSRAGIYRPREIESRFGGTIRLAGRSGRGAPTSAVDAPVRATSARPAPPTQTAASAGPRPRVGRGSVPRRLESIESRWRGARRCGRSFSFA